MDSPYSISEGHDSIRHVLQLPLELRVVRRQLLQPRAGPLELPVVRGPGAAQVAALKRVFPEFWRTYIYFIYVRCVK